MTLDDFLITLAFLSTLGAVFFCLMWTIETAWKRWERWQWERTSPRYNVRNGRVTRLNP